MRYIGIQKKGSSQASAGKEGEQLRRFNKRIYQCPNPPSDEIEIAGQLKIKKKQ